MRQSIRNIGSRMSAGAGRRIPSQSGRPREIIGTAIAVTWDGNCSASRVAFGEVDLAHHDTGQLRRRVGPTARLERRRGTVPMQHRLACGFRRRISSQGLTVRAWSTGWRDSLTAPDPRSSMPEADLLGRPRRRRCCGTAACVPSSWSKPKFRAGVDPRWMTDACSRRSRLRPGTRSERATSVGESSAATRSRQGFPARPR